MSEEFDVPHQVPLAPDPNGSGQAIAVFEIYIKTTPERLWEAITDPELRAKYNFGVGTESDWTAGLRRTRRPCPACSTSPRA